MQHDPTRNRIKLGDLPSPARLCRTYVVTVPAPQVSVSFSSQAGAMNQQDIERRAREAKMQNALEILADTSTAAGWSGSQLARFVRRTAREGLGREDTGS